MNAKLFFVLIGLALVSACAPTQPAPKPRPPAPALGQFDMNTISGIELSAYPITPNPSAATTAHWQAIYQAGLAQGNNTNAFSKLGDCMTENPYFLGPFGAGQFVLGEYAHLKSVIAQFNVDSFARTGKAAAGGFNVAGPLDSTWSDPQVCKAGESPLACEYRTHKPSIAIIMFGTNDVTYTAPDAFNFYLRTIVNQTLDAQVLPVLSTFPTRPEDPTKSLLLNRVVVKVATEYDVPLINLSRALEPLPHHGVDPADTIHLSVPADKRVDIFDAAHLQAGFTVRNLVTLQALEAVLGVVRR